ncbi:MAG: FkbM family methyltransferase [Tepidisphaeraceae bacterium]
MPLKPLLTLPINAFRWARSLRSGRAFSAGQKARLWLAMAAIQLRSVFHAPNKSVTARVLGFRISAFDAKALLYLLREVWIDEPYAIDLPESPTIVDCGANIGASVLFFALRHPRATILAYEPNPHAFAMLRKNVEANGLQNRVKLVNAALSDAPGSAELFFGDDQASLAGSLNAGRGGDRSATVELIRLSDEVRAKLSGRSIDLVKIDVEGAEHAVVRDMEASGLIGQVGKYAIEYHNNLDAAGPGKLGELLARFERAGFRHSIRAGFSRGSVSGSDDSLPEELTQPAM